MFKYDIWERKNWYLNIIFCGFIFTPGFLCLVDAWQRGSEFFVFVFLFQDAGYLGMEFIYLVDRIPGKEGGVI